MIYIDMTIDGVDNDDIRVSGSITIRDASASELITFFKLIKTAQKEFKPVATAVKHDLGVGLGAELIKAMK